MVRLKPSSENTNSNNPIADPVLFWVGWEASTIASALVPRKRLFHDAAESKETWDDDLVSNVNKNRRSRMWSDLSFLSVSLLSKLLMYSSFSSPKGSDHDSSSTQRRRVSTAVLRFFEFRGWKSTLSRQSNVTSCSIRVADVDRGWDAEANRRS